MYKSKYIHKPGAPRHRPVDTIYSAVVPAESAKPVFEPREFPYSIRDQHVYIPGKTRHGKSTLLHEMALQDIENGEGVCVLDPKGDLVESLLEWIPEQYKDKCIYFSMRDPIPLDFMSYAPHLKSKLVSDLKYVVTRGLDATAAPLMDAIIENLIYTLLDANDHPDLNKPDNLSKRCTFLDIYRFLKNEKRRKFILDHVSDSELKAEWDTMPNPKEAAPTLTRMNKFVRNPVLKKIFECPDPKLNLTDVMNNRKILLVNLAPLSDESKTVATLLIGKIRQAALERSGERVPFHLYADEFQFYQTSDFDEILSFAGGLGLRLTLANQYLSRLTSEVQGAIDGNVGSFIIFKIGKKDVNGFSAITEPYDSRVLLSLPKHQALYKLGDEPAFIKATPPPLLKPQRSHAASIKASTLDLYSCKSQQASHTSGDGSTQPSTSAVTHPETQATEQISHDAAQAPRRNLKKKNS